MFFPWTMPVYRPPVWLEAIVDNGLHYLRDEVSRLLGDKELLAKWIKHPCRDYMSAFTLAVGASVLWILFSDFQTWKIRIMARKTAREGATKAAAAMKPSPSPSPDPLLKRNATSTADNSKHMPSTPPQQNRTALFRRETPISSPSMTGAHVPSGNGGRTGRVFSPGYQTPFVNISQPSQKNFSYLRQKAPVTYATLRQDDVLNKDGTPRRGGFGVEMGVGQGEGNGRKREEE
ncbi:hypothetical protein SVAN01_08681 [Stagonosporopsis vannaccii]|nr:hypothetical protein SVAN01_08681 [Stagonosporopsis vannaccii]